MGLSAEATDHNLESGLGELLDARWDFIHWVPASRTHAWCRQDPNLTYMDRCGKSAGRTPDDELPGFDPFLDFQLYLETQGRAFERAVIEYLGSRWLLTQIGSNPVHARTLAKFEATKQAILDGIPLIYQAVLWDEVARTFGMVDLLVRSDVLYAICPAAFAGESYESLPRHYRVVDIKFMTLRFLHTGHPSKDHLAGMVQCWIYNQGLGRVQGYTPPFSYLLGRGWQQGKNRGTSCFDRLARVPHNDSTIAKTAREAIAWARLVWQEGHTWQLTPFPTRPELYPNMENHQDFPWHAAKEAYAREVGELTLLPRVSPRRRFLAHSIGITRWDDPALTSGALGFRGDAQGRILNAVLAANRQGEHPTVLPEKIISNDGNWRAPAPAEFYVDFETVNDLADDFRAIPEKGGAPRIFMIGCGHLDATSTWQFEQFVVRDLSLEAEGEMIDHWIAHLSQCGVPLSKIRLFHWSPAETSVLDVAYNSARARHPERHWPDLSWFDLLKRLARREPVTVTGAMNFGLKPVAKALCALGRIETSWPDDRLDGLAAMLGAWRASDEACAAGVSMAETALVQEIGNYNQVDCRVMMEILEYLRRSH